MSYCSPGTSGRRASCSYISTNLSSQFIPDTKRRNSAFSTLGLGLHTPSAPKECKKLQRFFRRRSNSLAEINGLSKSRLSTFTLGSNVNRKDATRRCQVVVEMHGGQKYIVTSEHGQSVHDAVETVAMEQKLTSYRIYLASSKALLDLHTDIGSLNDDHIILTDSEDGTSAEDTRYNLVETLLRREKLYQECLHSILDVYAEPLRKFSSLSAADHRVLFCSLEPILSFSTTLCLKINDAIQTWDPGTTRIGNLFSKQFWHHYDEYYLRYPTIRSLLKEKYTTDEEFTEFCRMRHGAAHHSLESLLLLPVQRISDYNTFLSRLVDATDPSHPDYDDLKKALDRVEMMMKDREKQLQNVENEQKMDTVQNRFPNDDLQLQEKDKRNKNPIKRRATAGAVLLKSLSKRHNHQSEKNVLSTSTPSGVDPSTTTVASLLPCRGATKRVYVLEGPVQLTAACQSLDRYLFLFSDLLLIAKQRSSSMYKLKQRVRVSEIWLANCISEVAESCRPHDRSMVIGWPTTNYVATFGSPEVMSVWREKLTKLIGEEKEKGDKSCIIKIRYTASEGCHACKTLSVTNREDACSVVERCIDEFHIQNAETDEYQLWSVSPGKDDPPYPLIGHEIPYAIRKNHDREWGHENSGEMIDSLKGLDLSYFTLQPVKKKPRDLSHDDPRRGKKVKRSPLHGIFRRNQKPSAVPPSGCLFGHSLDEISDGDKLPEPILVILQVLFLQGTYTVGVFRKPGNHKKCQDIKTKLDNGEPVTIDELTVPVAASLFKDFLMSLPNCLMGSHLFDQWVATANLTEDSQKEQRLNLCKKYISSLSQSQQNLLRHLMCVLHTIACVQMDKDQGMDAYGLAVCIGQSMLWPSLSNSCSMSDAVAKVPSVVQFLIENCEIIFGAQSLKIFGDLSQEVKQPQDSSTDSDSIHSLLSSLPEQQYVNTRDNSSLDSLERDCYYPEVDSSPQLAKSHLSPTNLSRDSGLTLSDTQLYEDCPDSESPSTTTRKPSYVRSYSQSDDQLPSADPGTLSSSQDAVILRHAGLPVPPPRKPKRRSAGPEFDNTATPKGLRNYGSTNIVCDHKRHYWNTPNSRRISDDSTLGSLDEEYPEELQTGLNLDRYRRGLDIGTLTKSESGAHLYLNDTDLMTSEGEFQHSLCLSSDQQPTAKTSTQDDYTRNDIQKLCGSLDLQASRNQSVADNQTFSIHSSLPTGLTAGISLEDLLTSSCSTASSAQSDLADAELYKPHMGNVKNDSDKTPSEQLEPKDLKSQKILNDSTKHPSSTSHVQLRNKGLSSGGSVDRSQRAKLVRSDAIEIKTLRKGMTPSGEDKFPAKIPLRKSLYSLDDDSLTKASTSGSNSSSSQPNCNQHHSPSSQQSYVTKTGSSSCRRSDSYSGLVPPLVRHLQQGIIEKSASDTVISEQFELSGPVRATSHPRPNNPPSYEEAVQRQSQRLRLSEQDIAVQQRNSAKAKKLYEESLKKYETAEIPGCCPPHRHQNKIDLLELSCHGSEQHPVGFRQPPPYQQACHRAADKQDQDKQKMYFQTKFTKYDGSQQLYGKKSREQHEDLTVGSTSEMDSERGLRHQESFTRYSSAPQITAQSKLEQSQTEPCDQDHRTNHHPVEINQEVKQMESPVPLAGLPVRHANSTAHQIRSPVQHAGSNGHRTGSPVHYTNSAARRAHSSDHSLSSHVNSEARQSNAKSASKKSYNASSTVVGNQEFKHLGRSTANNQNRRHVANLTLTTADSEELQNDQTKACEQIGRARDCSQQPNNREEVVSEDASSIQDKTVSEHISLVSCERSRQQHREGRRRSASRSHERRFDQRNSDPKLSSTKSAQITNLNRSKSDSQEHIDKVNRFKAFRAYENNKENISLEELRADSVISEYRCGAEQRPSNEYTRPPREESSRRRNVQNSCVLRTTSDKHQNSDSISASRRLSIPSSVRNRDWHKELASQYTETFFQPEKLEEAPNKVIRFGYLNSKEQCPTSGEKTRSRWTPPVHPTKDLIYVTKDDINTTETRQPRNMLMHSVKRRDNRSKSQERPISLVSDDVQKLQEFVRGRSETQHQKRNLNDVQNKMADVQALGDVSTNESGLNWSVAKLRNLYVGDKVQKERANLTARANNGTNPHFYTPGSKPPPPVFRHEERLNQTSQLAKCHSQKQQHYVKERTNPDADEAYV